MAMGPATLTRWEEVKKGASEYVRPRPNAACSLAGCIGSRRRSQTERFSWPRTRVSWKCTRLWGTRCDGKCRRFAPLDGSVSFGESATLISVWTRRLIICLYLMNMLGNPRKNLLSDRLKVPLKPIQDVEDIEKSTAKSDRDEVRRTRSACNNGLEFVGRTLMKRELWQLLVIIETVSRPVWHITASKTNGTRAHRNPWNYGWSANARNASIT